jgi:hypothetical protein
MFNDFLFTLQDHPLVLVQVSEWCEYGDEQLYYA